MNKTKRIVTIGLLCAMAYVVMLLSHMLPPMITALPFLKYDPKDVIIAIGGFIYDPVAAIIISVIVSLIEMVTISSTGMIGLLMNVLSSCAFCCTSALIYRKKRTLSGAVIGLAAACVLTTAVMLLWNWWITPLYTGQAVADILIPYILPFNLIKCALNAGLTVALYKPVVKSLRKAKLVPAASQSGKKSGFAGIIIALCVIAASVIAILFVNNIL